MKNITSVISFLFILAFKTAISQKRCEIVGDWTLAGTRTAQAEVYNRDRASFSKDSITLASGFYYPVIDQNNIEEWKTGRYPFVYYGRKEKYKVVGDSLYLFSTPYKEWDAFKIVCNESGKLQLIGKRKHWVLVREKPGTANKKTCTIRYIKAHVYEFEGVGNYDLNYRVTYSMDDKLIYEQLSEMDPDHTVKTFELKPGTFAEICQGFNYVDTRQIQSNYKASFSDPGIIELEVGLADGTVIRSRIADPEYPEELKLALIPVLYGHQRLAYPHLKPIDLHSLKK